MRLDAEDEAEAEENEAAGPSKSAAPPVQLPPGTGEDGVETIEPTSAGFTDDD